MIPNDIQMTLVNKNIKFLKNNYKCLKYNFSTFIKVTIKYLEMTFN